MPKIETNLDFTGASPAARDTSDADNLQHSSDRATENTVKPNIFNEYERILLKIVETIGTIDENGFPSDLDGIDESMTIYDALVSLASRKTSSASAAFTSDASFLASIEVTGKATFKGGIFSEWTTATDYDLGAMIIKDGIIYQAVLGLNDAVDDTNITSLSTWQDDVDEHHWEPLHRLAENYRFIYQDNTAKGIDDFNIGDAVQFDTTEEQWQQVYASSDQITEVFMVVARFASDISIVQKAGYINWDMELRRDLVSPDTDSEHPLRNLVTGQEYYLKGTDWVTASEECFTETQPIVSKKLFVAISSNEAFILDRPFDVGAEQHVVTFATDGGNDYDLGYSLLGSEYCIVFKEGTYVSPSAYTVNGSTFSFVSTPASGEDVVVHATAHVSAITGASFRIDYFDDTTGITEPGGAATVNIVNGTNKKFYLDPDNLNLHLSSNYMWIYIGDEIQHATPAIPSSTDFTVYSSYIEFRIAPSAGTKVKIQWAQSALITRVSDDTISTSKLMDGAVTGEKIHEDTAPATPTNLIYNGSFLDFSEAVLDGDFLARYPETYGSFELEGEDTPQSYNEPDYIRTGITTPDAWTIAGTFEEITTVAISDRENSLLMIKDGKEEYEVWVDAAKISSGEADYTGTANRLNDVLNSDDWASVSNIDVNGYVKNITGATQANITSAADGSLTLDDDIFNLVARDTDTAAFTQAFKLRVPGNKIFVQFEARLVCPDTLDDKTSDEVLAIAAANTDSGVRVTCSDPVINEVAYIRSLDWVKYTMTIDGETDPDAVVTLSLRGAIDGSNRFSTEFRRVQVSRGIMPTQWQPHIQESIEKNPLVQDTRRLVNANIVAIGDNDSTLSSHDSTLTTHNGRITTLEGRAAATQYTFTNYNIIDEGASGLRFTPGVADRPFVFDSLVTLPSDTPTADTHAASKKYVDDYVDAYANSNDSKVQVIQTYIDSTSVIPISYPITQLVIERFTHKGDLNTKCVSSSNWRSICWAPELGLLCAVADGGSSGVRVATSPDGVTWTTRTAAENNSWEAVCWSPELSLFCAVTETGITGQIMTSPDGTTWTLRSEANNNAWTDICWSPELGIFCAVARNGTGVARIMTSPDGTTWSARDVQTVSTWGSICWSPFLGLFVVVAEGGASDYVMTSPDGITWTTRSPEDDNIWMDVCWSPLRKIFCAVSYTGTSRAMISSDGINWTSQDGIPSEEWLSVEWIEHLGVFCALDNGGIIVTSPDGITWTEAESTASSGCRALCWNGKAGEIYIIFSDNTCIKSRSLSDILGYWGN